jgi:hypothetical protein
VSIDTLDEGKFKDITRWGDLNKVLAGLKAAQEAGLADQDQHGGAEGFQRARDRADDRVVP